MTVKFQSCIRNRTLNLQSQVWMMLSSRMRSISKCGSTCHDANHWLWTKTKRIDRASDDCSFHEPDMIISNVWKLYHWDDELISWRNFANTLKGDESDDECLNYHDFNIHEGHWYFLQPFEPRIHPSLISSHFNLLNFLSTRTSIQTRLTYKWITESNMHCVNTEY